MVFERRDYKKMKKEDLLEGIDRNALKNFLREKIDREIILKYLFIKSIEEKYEDEYIETKYRIKPGKIRRDYNALDKDKIGNIEKEILAKIEAGEINLNFEAVRWHRESLQTMYASERGKKGQEALTKEKDDI